MPKARIPFDYDRYHAMKAQGLSQRAIAREMGIPEGTLRFYLTSPIPEKQVKSTAVDLGPQSYIQEESPAMSQEQRLPTVDNPELTGLLSWWRNRQAAQDEPLEELKRWTVHVEVRWLHAIRRESDLTGDTYTQIVNRALRQYYERK